MIDGGGGSNDDRNSNDTRVLKKCTLIYTRPHVYGIIKCVGVHAQVCVCSFCMRSEL